MPPGIRVTRGEILKTAFEIVRKDGLQALSARRLAVELNCSVKPIYREYKSMKELEDEVVMKARQFGMDFISNTHDVEHPFLNMEMGYLNFSREERQLFEIFSMFGEGIIGQKDGKQLPDAEKQIEAMKGLPDFDGLSDAQLKRILMDMTIYIHGIAVMIGSDFSGDRKESIPNIVDRMLKTLIEWERNKETESFGGGR